MRSRIFYTDKYIEIAQNIKRFLNRQKNFLARANIESTRATGDAIQNIISEGFQTLLGKACTECITKLGRRAMGDVTFKDPDGICYAVDVKTHRIDTHFNMPNLTSVERLASFYESDKNCFVILLVTYAISGMKVKVSNVLFVPIEFLGWDCLTVGALGRGQIQIRNSNTISLNPQYSRKDWMLEFCERLFKFYPKERTKIAKSIARFHAVQSAWLAKADTWTAPPVEPRKVIETSGTETPT